MLETVEEILEYLWKKVDQYEKEIEVIKKKISISGENEKDLAKLKGYRWILADTMELIVSIKK